MNLTRIAGNKYNQLLLTFILQFLLSPLRGLANLVTSTLFFLMVAVVVRTLDLRRSTMLLYQGIAFLLFLSQVTPLPNFLSADFSLGIRIIGISIYCFYIGIPILYISRELFQRGAVDADTVKGGVCVYILIGIFWAILYVLVSLIDPVAFSKELSFADYMYLSFTTLTTLGYGDIAPQSLLARNLTSLEAIVGQMYPAIFIARLVSLYTSSSSRPS